MAGLLLLNRRPAWGRRLLVLDFLLLYLLSLPPVAFALRSSLEAYPPLSLQQIQDSRAQAIVVLGAGAWENGLDYGGPTPHMFSLIRTRYAAWLHRRTGLPVLVAGGGEKGTEGVAMRTVLLELGVPEALAWAETDSKNTQQNGLRARDYLEPKGVRRILLVTQGYHMRRAVWVFRKAGLDVVPAPCDPTAYSMYSRGVFSVIPQAEPLFVSCGALEEWLANAFYTLRY